MDSRKALLTGKKRVGVWGIGYIGYSSMSHYAERGVRCIGYDVNPQTVEMVNRGESGAKARCSTWTNGWGSHPARCT